MSTERTNPERKLALVQDIFGTDEHDDDLYEEVEYLRAQIRELLPAALVGASYTAGLLPNNNATEIMSEDEQRFVDEHRALARRLCERIMAGEFGEAR